MAIDIQEIASQIVQSTENLSKIEQLLALMTPHDHEEEVVHMAIHTLVKIFGLLIFSDNRKNQKPNAYLHLKEPQASYLQSKCREYELTLFSSLSNSPNTCNKNNSSSMGNISASLQISIFTALLDLLKLKTERNSATQRSGKQWTFNFVFFQKIMDSLLNIDVSQNYFLGNLLNLLVQYDDLRFYFQKYLVSKIKKQQQQSNGTVVMEVTPVLLDVLLALPPPPPAFKSESEAFFESTELTLFCSNQYSLKQQHELVSIRVIRALYTECWLKILQCSLSIDVYKKILSVIHKKIIPHLTQPTLLIDFLSDSYDQGSIVSLLALNGLFTLIQDYNLDFPDFFPKLYSLLDRNILHVKYRSRFFRLLQLFLSSSLLPSNMVAGFIKRLARLCLFAPPAGILIILPMIYNLLRVHPSCIRMIHLQGAMSAQDLNGLEDPYLHEASRPEQSHAESSYLWELVALKHHYHPSVSTMAKIFEEPFTQPNYDLEDFLDLTFDELIEQEMKAKQDFASLAFTKMDLIEDDGNSCFAF